MFSSKPKFDANKCKTNLKMLVNRFQLLVQKKTNLNKQQKRKVALLLREDKAAEAEVLVEHIIRRRTRTQWDWGPISSRLIWMHEIDSSRCTRADTGDGRSARLTVMDLCVPRRALTLARGSRELSPTAFSARRAARTCSRRASRRAFVSARAI